MTFTEDIKKALIETHKDANDASLDMYIKDTARLYNGLNGLKFKKNRKKVTLEEESLIGPLNKEGNLNWIKETDKIENYFDKNKFAITTRAKYYSYILEILGAMNYDKKMIKIIKEKRDVYKNQYDNIEDALKSKKQEENFTGIDAKTINDKIDEYEKEIKQDNLYRLQIWMILKILREFNFRNEEVATMEFVDKKTYDKEKGPGRNMIVRDPDGWFCTKNKYKTLKIYGELIIPLDKQILKDIQFFHKKVGDGMLFKSSFQETKRPTNMTSNSFGKYVTEWSNKELPPVELEDGSKRPRNLGPTMIVKVYQSDKHGESKAKMLSLLSKDSKNRGNKPATMNKYYVSMRKPTGFV